MEIIYRSIDGIDFDNKDDCIAHENTKECTISIIEKDLRTIVSDENNDLFIVDYCSGKSFFGDVDGGAADFIYSVLFYWVQHCLGYKISVIDIWKECLEDKDFGDILKIFQSEDSDTFKALWS